MVDTNYIREFRETINYRLPLLNNRLRTCAERNLWSVVCSAMDWIETAAHWLSRRNSPEVHNDPYEDSMNVAFYISAVDMLFEGTDQLYRVIYGDVCGKEDAVLMKGCQGIFSNNGYCEDDRTFFKEVRAIFGEHSVNLKLDKLFYPNDEREEHKTERWFASWSYSLSGLPTEVQIYSNQQNKPPIHFSIDIGEIINFAEVVGKWTKRIMEKSVEIEESLKKEYIDDEWKVFSRDCYKEHIQFLHSENKRRQDSEYYKYALFQIETILSSEIESNYVKALKKNAYSVLLKIDSAIHRLSDLEDLSRIEPSTELLSSDAKAYNSLFCYVMEGFDKKDYDIWGDGLRDKVKDMVDVDISMPPKDQYVLITAALLKMEGKI